MKKGMLGTVLGILMVAVILVIIAFISGALFIVDESQQVVITQFGKPIGNPIVAAGLHFKKPFIQQIHYFEKRILDWDGDANQIPTQDKKYIWVDTTARWKIVDALKFLQSVGNEMSAHSRLDDIINSATRDVITNHLLVEAVRDSDRILESKELGADAIFADEALERISVGRQQLTRVILEKAKILAPQYGIEIVDVRIKRVNYVEDVRNKVYDRMISERKRAAEKYRSEGQGKSAEISGQVGKELKLITSDAYRQAQGIVGKADAEAINIYAQSYSLDPEFYAFLKTLETYQKTIDENSTIILTTDSDYYKYLKSMDHMK
ncbi:MAG: protease modulator HflC [Candidatus Omnitrophica bacterium]|nr:protease modulator HflC [Candidatus Omnitrophota bacterium]MBU1047186.1 protease modulator HflC [Candidatus Omnitrophota bacterium]MBU1630258.1 protease modulator HflC [Candidatus Omnitrophota bacterium]MBU1766839.1 protease modulator HflC [Candidatus Omnitrophota bacterium]MBU1889486.1 protease modulator HflC [Candidatus Omnitrophota bacterium]